MKNPLTRSQREKAAAVDGSQKKTFFIVTAVNT
jgi:hypothetical protein